MTNVKAALLVFATFLFQSTFSQITKGLELQVFAGTSVYQGDLTHSLSASFKNMKPSYGIGLKKKINNYFSGVLSVSKSTLMADEATDATEEWVANRLFNFYTSYTDVTAQIHFNLFGDNTADYQRKLQPYAGFGIGASFINVSRDYSKVNWSYFDSKSQLANGLPLDVAAKIPKTVVLFPITMGMKYFINNRISAFSEVVAKLSTSDFIDGFKYAGNPDRPDNYYNFHIGLSFNLGNNFINCPKTK